MPPDEIDFPPNEIESDNESSNSDPTPNLDDYELEFEPDTTNHPLPSYRITNFPMMNLEHDDHALLLLDEKDDISLDGSMNTLMGLLMVLSSKPAEHL